LSWTLLPERRRSAERRELRSEPLLYRVWGYEGIDDAARTQMEQAMRLTITVGGALMPDAHVGYGSAHWGVLATHEAVIPYAVGVDIACRMRLSVYREDPGVLDDRPRGLEQMLRRKTYFGAGVKNPDKPDHEVLADDAWSDSKLLRGPRDLAA